MFTDLFSTVTHSPYWIAAGWTMLHFLWIGAVIAVFTLVLRRILDRAASPVRHAAVLLCFLALAISPIVIYRSTVGRISTVPAEHPIALPTSADEQSLVWVVNSSSEPMLVTRAPSLPAPSAANVAPPTLVDELRTALDRAAKWLPLLWAAGFVLTMGVLGAGLVGATRLCRRGRPLTEGDPDLHERLARLCRELGIHGRVGLRLCADVCAPVLIGIVKPVILLPPSLLAGLSSQQLELVLLHELAHVRRWDNLVNLFQRIVEGVLFFHPAVWIVSRWLRLEREHCCDAIVLRHTSQPRVYVETLASLALPGVGPRYAAAAMANHQLVSRIRRILNLEDRTMSLSRSTLGVVAAIAAIALIICIGAVSANDRISGNDRIGGVSGLVAQAQAQDAPAAGLADPLVGAQKQHPPAAAGLVDLAGAALGGEVNAGERLIDFHDAHVGVLNANRGCASCHNPANTRWTKTQAQATPAPHRHEALDALGLRLLGQQERGRAWGPEQATGAPDVPRAADDGRAWASLSEDGQDEWLELGYGGGGVETSAILIYETYNPGAVFEVVVTDDQNVRHRVFSGKDPSAGTDKAVLVVPIGKPIKIVSVRIEIASTKVQGWNEIDAVGLVNAKTGEVAWADAARASSTYAEPNARPPGRNGLVPGNVGAFEKLFEAQLHVADTGRNLPQVMDTLGYTPHGINFVNPGVTTSALAPANPEIDQLRKENEELRAMIERHKEFQRRQEKTLIEIQRSIQETRPATPPGGKEPGGR